MMDIPIIEVLDLRKKYDDFTAGIGGEGSCIEKDDRCEYFRDLSLSLERGRQFEQLGEGAISDGIEPDSVEVLVMLSEGPQCVPIIRDPLAITPDK